MQLPAAESIEHHPRPILAQQAYFKDDFVLVEEQEVIIAQRSILTQNAFRTFLLNLEFVLRFPGCRLSCLLLLFTPLNYPLDQLSDGLPRYPCWLASGSSALILFVLVSEEITYPSSPQLSVKLTFLSPYKTKGIFHNLVRDVKGGNLL